MDNTPNENANKKWDTGPITSRFIAGLVIFVVILGIRSCIETNTKVRLEAEQAKQEEIREAERARECEHAEQIRAQPIPEEQQHFASNEELQLIDGPGDLVISLPHTWEEGKDEGNTVNFSRENRSGLLTLTWEPTQSLLYASTEEAIDHVTSSLDSIVLEDEDPETGKIGEALWYRYPVYSQASDDGEAQTYGYLEVVVSGRDLYSIVALSYASSYTEEIHGELIRILNSIDGVSDSPQYGVDSAAGDGDTAADAKNTAAQDDGPMPDFLVSLGDFKTFTVRGTGNDIVGIPTTNDSVIYSPYCHLTVTFDSEGRNTLVRQGQNSEDGSCTLIDRTGPYSGTLTNMTDVMGTMTQRQLAVTTDGSWSITFAPMSATERLVAGTTYTGDNMLYLSAEPVSKLHITHEGDGMFRVTASGMEDTKKLVDATGPYDDEVAWEDPDTLFLIEAEGNWSISW